MSRSVSRAVTLVLSIGGTIAAAVLVIIHYGFRPICPRFLRLPACTLVLPAYSATLASSAAKRDRPHLFWGGALLGLVLAIRFSLTGGRECPKLRSLPLCFVSLAAFAAMIGLRLLSRPRETDD